MAVPEDARIDKKEKKKNTNTRFSKGVQKIVENTSYGNNNRSGVLEAVTRLERVHGNAGYTDGARQSRVYNSLLY